MLSDKQRARIINTLVPPVDELSQLLQIYDDPMINEWHKQAVNERNSVRAEYEAFPDHELMALILGAKDKEDDTGENK